MRRLLVLAVIAALLGPACGSGGVSGNPKDAFGTALDNLRDYQGITFSLSIDSDTTSLAAASEGALTDDQAQKILDSSVTLSANPADKPEDGKSELTVNLAGNEDAVEYRVVNGNVYFRADVGAIASTFGISASDIDGLREEAAAQPGYEFVGDVLDGKWVAFTGIFDALSQLSGVDAKATPSAQDQQVMKEVADILEQSTTVKEGSKEGPGTNLVVSLPLRPTYEKLRSSLSSLSTLASTPEVLPSASTVPDKTISIDVWVQDDRLTQVSFDTIAIAKQLGAEDPPAGMKKLVFVVGLDEFAGDIEAPSDATEVDLMQLLQGLTTTHSDSASARLRSTTPSGDAFCAALKDQLKGQPKDVVKALVDQYGKQCPNLTK